MGQGLSMAARHEVTKKYAREYAGSAKKDKGRMLDELVGVTGWSRANARRAIATVGKRRGRAGSVRRKQRAPTYGYDTLKVLIEVWTLIGEPCGKYLAPIMAATLERLEVFGELDQVGHRLTPQVRAQLVAMSPVTIDRMLRPTKAALSRGEVRDPSRCHVAVLDHGASGDGRDGEGAGLLRDRPGRALRAHPQG